ncbi:pyruvate carboxylase [Planctomicrobium piriforme]|uniref:Pyruvate carboxylase n=1 Tax=Planctomicrobium piriforme TaxID=1576369 RepID=A0A1I3G6K8_9PLAN|nr:pyruvate carboxylase [Planctomicrobium piriforme]SFI19135.1 pyruvate carboxylase [Planctomicrobium piriforme]
MKKFQKLLVANRSEIAIRVFRTASELEIRTVAIYAYEDRFALHRFKADEAYQVGKPGEPIRSYLDIPSIIAVAKEVGVDAIHPGYGFLSEKPEFAAACEAAGITFVGPRVDLLENLGDKTAARRIAVQAQVPVLAGTENPLKDAEEGLQLAAGLGYPVMLKAAHGGGGRGMRIVESEDQLAGAYESARQESLTAFGSPDIFIEKYIRHARHIEVQLLGDQHGNLVHLYERDCSVQRRHQKVIEIAPAVNLDPAVRDAICEAALAIGRQVNYQNAGTVEFLVDAETQKFFFIEVNPRIQVEHTVTEEVTGIDIVRSQIMVAQGARLDDPEIGITSQSNVKVNGYALQCRVTTEDPANNFVPDYGRIAHYRSASGMGIRLDAGTAFSGAFVHPYYDSLMVKVSARGRRFSEAARRMDRCLREFRVRGVKTNIPFLLNVLNHPDFLAGRCTTTFIDQTPSLFDFPRRRDRATRILRYIGETIVNGNPLVKGRPVATRRLPAPLPKYDVTQPRPAGSRDKFKELGAEKFSQWIKDQQRLLITDTTFRDAHQSLHATRFRTYDMLKVVEAYSYLLPELFSLEMWGGATFDTSMRFLKECPWERLARMREQCPNILFQMLLRASSAVGYSNFPDNLVKNFVKEAAAAGNDIFRVFDALNWADNMQVAIEAVCESGGICEAAICYTGDLLNPNRTKYDLKYYITLAKQLEKMGSHILAIKDMAGLCKPEAAEILVKALKQEVGLPIHFHTHDTAGIQAASLLLASKAGVDVVDAAMAPMSGGTSQVNLNTLCESLRNQPRDTGLDSRELDGMAEYWRVVREFYMPFESVVLPGTADLYNHEMPGGQYTNLFEQARALGMADRWSEICKAYADVNQMFGDIVKVTPTSKAVGDMALFMVANELTPADLLASERELAFPESVIDLISGAMGQPPGGFPEAVQKRILKDKKPFEGRPGATLPPIDFKAAAQKMVPILGREPTERELLSWVMYPGVFKDYAKHRQDYGDTSVLPTPVFFFGMQSGEEFASDIEPGKTLFIKFLATGSPHPDGTRTVFFELNGQPRDVTIDDRSVESTIQKNIKADTTNPSHIAASMPGMVVSVVVQAGDKVKKGQKMLVVEAMKMQTTLNADREGTIGQLLVKAGTQVATGDLLLTIE